MLQMSLSGGTRVNAWWDTHLSCMERKQMLLVPSGNKYKRLRYIEV